MESEETKPRLSNGTEQQGKEALVQPQGKNLSFPSLLLLC